VRVAPGRRIELLRRARLARDRVPRNRREAPGAAVHDSDEQPGQRPRRVRRDHLPDRLGLEVAKLAALGVEGRSHESRLHQRAAVGDGAERGRELEGRHRDLLADGHRRQRQGRPALRVAEEPTALAGQPDAGHGAEAERLHVAVVAVAAEREPTLIDPTLDEFCSTSANVSQPYFFQSRIVVPARVIAPFSA